MCRLMLAAIVLALLTTSVQAGAPLPKYPPRPLTLPQYPLRPTPPASQPTETPSTAETPPRSRGVALVAGEHARKNTHSPEDER